ncbi:hypothetical protein OEA41_002843 [Lepraria neglecta]|uniref:Uncharacterized protein n=1 Tax=Lepraria neglecta TaxID=209136 RepID=A0AAD9Z3J7_9LECA|nr:hypothetical protein OEA41_002843 [Lepraria neglecta]
MSFSTIAILLAALGLQTHALPTSDNLNTDLVERQAGPVGVLPEILMVAVIDAGGPAVEAFGLGGQIAKELFGNLDQDEPYVKTDDVSSGR